MKIRYYFYLFFVVCSFNVSALEKSAAERKEKITVTYPMLQELMPDFVTKNDDTLVEIIQDGVDEYQKFAQDPRLKLYPANKKIFFIVHEFSLDCENKVDKVACLKAVSLINLVLQKYCTD